ncbi:MAG: glycoside hydrolase family 65 protein [Alphaproteobacteria bacterium]
MATALRERLNLPRDIFPLHEWKIEAKRFYGRYLAEAETIFSTANGYLGIRGGFLEGHPVAEEGTFINGFHEIWPIVYGEEAYGFPKTGQTMVSVTDSKTIRLYVDGERFELSNAEIVEFRRTLDMAAATLERELVWRTPSGNRISIKSTRLVSFPNRHLAAISYEVTALDRDAELAISSEIVNREPVQDDGTDPRKRQGFQDKVFHPLGGAARGQRVVLCHETGGSRMRLACGIDHVVETESPHSFTCDCSDDRGAVVFSVDAEAGKPVRLSKFMAYYGSGDKPMEELRDTAEWTLNRAVQRGFEELLRRQREYVDDFWRNSDVRIGGAPELQQIIRWNLFQLLQASGRAEGVGIGARALSGSAYEGHYFWDAEMYVLPFLIYTAPRKALRLLEFRYSQLAKARVRARQLGHRGAMFPWRTINGDEASAYYAAGTAQYHLNADIVFAIEKYVNATGDEDFLRAFGAEILVETARLWIDLGFYSERHGGRFCINGVTGPDEYTAVVNNNFFTNIMARENLRYAAEALKRLHDTEPGWFGHLAGLTDLDPAEMDEWQNAAERMFLPYDERAQIYQQDDTFLDKEVWDFENTPIEKHPLLLHYHPLNLYRHQVIKQADIMLAMFLLGQDFSMEEKKRCFDYYDPLTTGDSSLSACIQSILASEVGYAEAAYRYFRYAAVVDLGDAAGNVADGVHIASIGGCWMALVYGFGGMRDYGGELTFRPRLPAEWESLSFPLTVRGRILDVDVRHDETTYTLREGDELTIRHGDQRVELKRGRSVSMSAGGA